MNNHLPTNVVYKADLLSLSAVGGFLAGWLPTLALLLPVIWYSYLLATSIYDRYKGRK